MGIVFKAEDTRLKRLVALKFLPQDLTRDPDAKARFIQEARAASALDHPNIGAIYEIDQTPDGQIFIAMAFYDGLTLREKIAEPNLLIADCLDLAVQIAQGLAQAHKNRIVHRDIKPANIMITQEGLVKIVDFGLAKLGGGAQLTQVGVAMGTPVYMSPEQIRGQDVDQRADIWALGVVLFEMFTGQLPFRGETQQGVFYAVLNQESPPLPSLRFNVPLELEQVIHKALQKKPENRYASMQAMVDELRRIQRQISRLQQRPVAETQSEASTLLQKTERALTTPKTETMRVMQTAPPKPSKKLLWIGAAVVTLLVIGGIGLFTFIKPITEKLKTEKPKTELIPNSENRPQSPIPAVNWQASADSAKGLMQQAETAASRENAAKLATAALQRATQTKKQGDNDYLAAKYQTAKEFYLTAANQFQNAQSEAQRNRAKQITDLTAAQKQEAETARNQTAFKKRLVPANAKDAPVYQQALAAETEGEKQWRNGDYVPARRSFEKAQKFYAQAAKATPPPVREQNEETLALPGRLNVNAVVMENGQERPAAAVVLINRQEKPEQTPRSFSLPAGQYRLGAKLFGYVLQGGEQVVTIRSGETTRYKFVFVKP